MAGSMERLKTICMWFYRLCFCKSDGLLWPSFICFLSFIDPTSIHLSFQTIKCWYSKVLWSYDILMSLAEICQ